MEHWRFAEGGISEEMDVPIRPDVYYEAINV